MTQSWKNNKSKLNEFIGIEKTQIQFETIMKTHHSTVRLLLLVFSLALVGFSCKKSPNTIGNNLIDGGNYIGIYYTDTLPILCHSVMDSIGTKNVSTVLLGSMKDPVFGTTTAGFYTQFHLSSINHKYGSNPILDSLVLQLYVGGFYGDTTTLQTLHVYEMTDTISTHEQYYCYSDVPVGAVDHANGYQCHFRPHTSGYIITNDTIERPIIRIPLSQELGNFIMNIDSSAYKEPDLFKQEFPGLYVTAETVSQDGGIGYINLTNNTFSQLQLYYHEAETPNKTLRYDFYVTQTDVYFNRYIHDYTQGDPDFVDQVVNGNESLGQETLYVQAMGGVKTILQIPDIDHWRDTLQEGHIVINEAKLVIPAHAMIGDSSLFKAPTNYVLVGLNQDGTTYLLPDYLEGTSYWGGTYSESAKSVTFRISEYFADMVRGVKPNLGLSFGINGAAYNAMRWIIAGPQAEQSDKLHLEVTYSIVGD